MEDLMVITQTLETLKVNSMHLYCRVGESTPGDEGGMKLGGCSNFRQEK
jgi:hypothetical protein